MQAAWVFVAASLFSLVSGPSLGQDTRIPAEEAPYRIEVPGQRQQLASLWGERASGPAGTLLKVPGGFVAPVHAHTASYRAVLVEGRWRHWLPDQPQGNDLLPGSYWTQVKDQPHVDACVSDTSCVLLLVNDDPYTTYLAPQ